MRRLSPKTILAAQFAMLAWIVAISVPFVLAPGPILAVTYLGNRKLATFTMAVNFLFRGTFFVVWNLMVPLTVVMMSISRHVPVETVRLMELVELVPGMLCGAMLGISILSARLKTEMMKRGLQI